MGTSATVRFKYRGDNPILVNVCHHNDGYIEGIGHDLAKFLLSKKIVNGISDFDDRNAIANGFSCLIAQYISNVKKCPGSVYICPQDFEGDYNYDVVYNDCKNEICIKVTHFDKVLFKGSPKELLEYKEEVDEGEDMTDKEIINNDKWREAITVISKWLEQEHCDDCVSREAVMNILGDSINDDKDFHRAVVLLNNLPPVIPKESEEKMKMSNFEDIKAYDVPTNGSIFLKTYPDSHVSNIAYDDGVCYVYVDLGGSRIRFTSDWWNATYKEACRAERN